jgi:chromosome segregation ATPase|tara:strand:+ start:2299 stop:3033 length:735 start_codon:yes stop_codon:yes gene_type:complete
MPYMVWSQSTQDVEDDKTLLQEAINIEASSSNDASNRQEFIDNVDAEIITLTGDIQFLSQQLDLTNIYNRQLQELIDSQNAEIISINSQMIELDKTNKGILPTLEEMVNTLESIIENDTPFLLTERKLRVDELKNILKQSNISTSEKFRRVFEAYQIENEYGRTIESYRDEIFFDSNTYNVEIFRLGRVGLYARTSDGRHTAIYSKKDGMWIGKKGIDSELVIALKIARKELPPSLLKLPIERI